VLACPLSDSESDTSDSESDSSSATGASDLCASASSIGLVDCGCLCSDAGDSVDECLRSEAGSVASDADVVSIISDDPPGDGGWQPGYSNGSWIDSEHPLSEQARLLAVNVVVVAGLIPSQLRSTLADALSLAGPGASSHKAAWF